MQRLCRIGVTACALVFVAASARADPFTLDSNARPAAGESASWFNGAVKIDTGAQLFLTESIVWFGGERISIPNAAISFTPRGTPGSNFSSGGGSIWTSLSGGGNAFFFGGGAFSGAGAFNRSPGISNGSGPHDFNAGIPGFFVPAPWAGPAYNPFNPDLNFIGVDPGGDFRSHLPDAFTDWRNDPSKGYANGDPPDPVPTTPEPSPLLLLATGLGVFLIWKNWDTLKHMTA